MSALDDEGWLTVFARIGAEIRERVGPLFGTEPGRAELSTGAGGDRTLELDRLAEETAVGILRAEAERGVRFSLLSEEAGRLDFGAEYPLVVLDPIDGSLNAKQGIPVYAVMATLLDGPRVADTRAGYTINLVSGQVWTAVRGRGARRDGVPLRPLPPQRPGALELLGLESTPASLALAAPLVEAATKIRLLGSMAVSLAQVASGGLSLFCSPIPARVFDMTAGLLLLAEVGGSMTDLEGGSLQDLEVGLQSRTTLLAASDPALHARGLGLLSARS